ncbi:MAG: hypothetical protein LBM70_03715 [Victivallales bacterium]|jgi:hypothetical protein|nr:hypothetical protein [Victivallales bacterium]
MTQRQIRFYAIAIGLLLLALFLRLPRFTAALEYDEIWTLESYASKSVMHIFSELDLPNNHPINSLAVKLTPFSENSPYWIRLFPLLAGLGAVWLAWVVGFGIYKRRSAALWCMFFMATLPGAFFYSQQARGYSFQLCFLLLFTAGLFCVDRRPGLGALGILLGGVGAMLSLPTSAIYLGGIGSFALFCCRKEWKRHLLGGIMLVITGILALVWVAINFNAYQANRVWGFPIDSLPRLGEFLVTLLKATVSPEIAALSIISIVLVPKRGAAILWIFSLAVVTAIAFNAGPERTYLPLAGAFALLAGGGAAELCRKLPRYKRFMSIFLIGWSLIEAFGAYSQPFLDWNRIHRLVRDLPPEMLVVVGANDSYPIAYNNAPEAYRDQLRRLAPLPKERQRLLLTLDRKNHNTLNGCNIQGNETELVLNISGRPIDFDVLHGNLYGLEELHQAPNPGDTVIAFIRPFPEAEAKNLQAMFAMLDGFLTLNVWLCPSVTENGVKYRYYLLSAKVEQPEKMDWKGFLNKKPGATALFKVIPLEKTK